MKWKLKCEGGSADAGPIYFIIIIITILLISQTCFPWQSNNNSSLSLSLSRFCLFLLALIVINLTAVISSFVFRCRARTWRQQPELWLKSGEIWRATCRDLPARITCKFFHFFLTRQPFPFFLLHHQFINLH